MAGAKIICEARVLDERLGIVKAADEAMTMKAVLKMPALDDKADQPRARPCR